MAAGTADAGATSAGVGAMPSTLLRQLADALRAGGWLSDIHVIEHTRVPLIKACVPLPPEVATACDADLPLLQLDISMEGSHHSGRASTSLTRDVFLHHLPKLRPLVLVLKQLLASRHLNSAATGGLGSYALVLMAASLLEGQAGLGAAPVPGVGQLLTRFLDYFSALPGTPDALHAVVLDSASRLRPLHVRRETLLGAANEVVSASRASDTLPGRGGSEGTTLPLDADYEEAVFATSLLVQDPLSPTFSNVSGAAFRWAHVQQTFREALHRVQNALAAGVMDAVAVGEEGTDGPLLAALLSLRSDGIDH